MICKLGGSCVGWMDPAACGWLEERTAGLAVIVVAPERPPAGVQLECDDKELWEAEVESGYSVTIVRALVDGVGLLTSVLLLCEGTRLGTAAMLAMLATLASHARFSPLWLSFTVDATSTCRSSSARISLFFGGRHSLLRSWLDFMVFHDLTPIHWMRSGLLLVVLQWQEVHCSEKKKISLYLMFWYESDKTLELLAATEVFTWNHLE